MDVMATMRGCDPFPELWQRRRRIRLPGIGVVNVLALPDLVQAKKTQRDKDWPMIRRLVETDYHSKSSRATSADACFWLMELRTPELLTQVVRDFPQPARRLEKRRPLLRHARQSRATRLRQMLMAEESRERRADRHHWLPLRHELAKLRRQA